MLTAFTTMMSPQVMFFFQEGGDGEGAAIVSSLCSSLCSLILVILMIVALWKIFVKAGQPGWASIIPFYNLWILIKIVGRPGWWFILFFIPFVNFIAMIVIYLDLAKSFGKSMLFGVGLILLAPIFLLLLAFGDANYEGPIPAF